MLLITILSGSEDEEAPTTTDLTTDYTTEVEGDETEEV